MVKTKGGREMNPADAFRKEQRKKEVARNKLERKFVRGAIAKKDKPDDLKSELKQIIEAEQEGPLNKQLRLRKKVLQEAFDKSIKAKKVRSGGLRRFAAGFTRPGGWPAYVWLGCSACVHLLREAPPQCLLHRHCLVTFVVGWDPGIVGLCWFVCLHVCFRLVLLLAAEAALLHDAAPGCR